MELAREFKLAQPLLDQRHWKRKRKLCWWSSLLCRDLGGGCEPQSKRPAEENCKENGRHHRSQQACAKLQATTTTTTTKSKNESDHKPDADTRMRPPDSQTSGSSSSSSMIDLLRTSSGHQRTPPSASQLARRNQVAGGDSRPAPKPRSAQKLEILRAAATTTTTARTPSTDQASMQMRSQCLHPLTATVAANHNYTLTSITGLACRRRRRRRRPPVALLACSLLAPPLLLLLLLAAGPSGLALAQHQQQPQSLGVVHSDPRPTIYSGQVSFGLLLSAHSTLGGGAELATAASQPAASQQLDATTTTTTMTSGGLSSDLMGAEPTTTTATTVSSPAVGEPAAGNRSSAGELQSIFQLQGHLLSKRQIFDRTHSPNYHVRRQQQHQGTLRGTAANRLHESTASSGQSSCNQVNPSALYAGMGAIWASHQANLVGDSQLSIGTYIYDSCNDLDVGQRQSVRIVSNLNAFQQTTCELPRGSPISLTIAHGDNQLRAIQLLTSFRVPVVTTREHFALEDYQQLTGDQRRYLFSTAPSSRHLAMGALRFAKLVVSRSSSSPKLPNQFHKLSSRNGLIVISRNLPARFIAYLTETIPAHVNYEMLQSSQPIDQIRSVEALESILISKPTGSASAASLDGAASAPDESQLEPWPAAAASSQRPTKIRAKFEQLAAKPGSQLQKPVQQPHDQHQHQHQLDKRWAGQESAASSDADSSEPADGSAGSTSSDEFGAAPSPQADADAATRMLSPTILMFITPAEAIDLITRLRNDLAEVSKYYSLVVTTREDISPALKTIFHRGGSRLCSGKAFYTISPVAEDIGEFGRYFRDTVQMEGEASDHPLVCEFAKHQASSRTLADLDDAATEPVIKAVWSAAAAFKSVYRSSQCSALLREPPPLGDGGPAATTAAAAASATTAANKLHGRQSSSPGGKSASSSASSSSASAHQECMVKMNKNLSNLVQRALRRLDVTINSTGLQALDGFRIKFDELNELTTNKFSIKYVNKECEIVEIGQYTGLSMSQLHLDDDTLRKSLESALPDPWPAPAASTAASQAAAPAASSSQSSASPLDDQQQPTTATAASNGLDEGSGEQVGLLAGQQEAGGNGLEEPRGGGDDDSGPSSSADQASGANYDSAQASEPPKRRRQQHQARGPVQPGGRRLGRPADKQTRRRKQIAAATTTTTTTAAAAAGGRGLEGPAGEPDTTEAPAATPMAGRQPVPTTTTTRKMADSRAGTTDELGVPATGRPLKQFPTGAPTTVRDWLPKVELDSAAAASATTTTTRSPLAQGGQSSSAAAAASWPPAMEQTTVQPVANPSPARPLGHQETTTTTREAGPVASADSSTNRTTNTTASTTQAPVYHSTLPESGGNTDLDMPTVRKEARGQPQATRSVLEMAASSTTEASASSEFVTLPSSSLSSGLNSIVPTRRGSGQDFEGPLASAGPNQTVGAAASEHSDRFASLRDLSLAPVPLLALLNASSRGGGGGSGGSSQPQLLDASQQQRQLLLEASNQETQQQQQQHQKTRGRDKLRTNLRWIYSRWFTLTILGANIFGALLTLYVLTFLLMKNCDGSLDRENQGVRSLHLLAIVVVFFGSTLFIIYPTPGICLLRTSWHNFAMVMVFGSLLLQAMQVRSLSSLGLGGRPNRLNQFLTLVFMVGVQVSFELQRWKYESANYLNFVQQYFGEPGSSSAASPDKRLLLFSGALGLAAGGDGQSQSQSSLGSPLSLLSSFQDQATPVSIQASERYHSLLQDYCSQPTDDFLQSQAYLWLIIGLLVVFTVSGRRLARLRHLNSSVAAAAAAAAAPATTPSNHHKLGSAIMMQQHYNNTGKLTTASRLLAGQMDAAVANSNNHPVASQFGGRFGVPGGHPLAQADHLHHHHHHHHHHHAVIGNVFMVTLVSVPIYFVSIVLHVHGQSVASQDMIFSATMVAIAFTTLIGIFMPIVHQANSGGRAAAAANFGHQHHQRFLDAGAGLLGSSSSSSSPLGAGHPQHLAGNKFPLQAQGATGHHHQHQAAGAFAMFPEFAPSGLRRPSSISGDSSSGAGSRRPFAETKESRRNMSVALAHLDPSMDSLRSMGVYSGPSTQANYRLANTGGGGGGGGDSALVSRNESAKRGPDEHSNHPHRHHRHHSSIDPALLNLKLNLAADDELSPIVDHDLYLHNNNNNNNNNSTSKDRHHHSSKHAGHHHHHQQQQQGPRTHPAADSRRPPRPSSSGGGGGGGEKRLIMLDVDPCCPKHGVAAWPRNSAPSCSEPLQ